MSLQIIQNMLPGQMFRAERKGEGDELTVTCKNCDRAWELECDLAIGEIIGEVDEHSRYCGRGKRFGRGRR